MNNHSANRGDRTERSWLDIELRSASSSGKKVRPSQTSFQEYFAATALKQIQVDSMNNESASTTRFPRPWHQERRRCSRRHRRRSCQAVPRLQWQRKMLEAALIQYKDHTREPRIIRGHRASDHQCDPTVA